MKDLNKIAAECMRELDALDIPYRKPVKFVVNTRAKSRWGQCKPIMGGGFIISISSRLLTENASLKGLKDTINHELLHTCDGCLNHQAKWKNYADKVNRAYGYNIKTASDAADKGVEEIVRKRKVNHMFVCEGCGQVVTRERDRGFVNLYRCGDCGGNFRKEY